MSLKETQDIYTCTNPAVENGTMFCDGNCWACGYHQKKGSDVFVIKMYPNKYKVSDEIKEIISNTFKGNSEINKENLTHHAMLGAEWRLSHKKEPYQSVYVETDLRYPYNADEGRSYSEALNATAFQYGAEVAYNIMRRKEKTK